MSEPTKITTREEVAYFFPANGRTFEIDEIRNAVDGNIEIIHIDDDQIMIINEEGKFSKAPNLLATRIAHLYGAISERDYICGDVVICPSPMLP